MANTYSYPHVEDYIEIIAGFRAPDGRNKYSIFQLPESPINLARYDVKIVESFAEQSRNAIGFTDKQAKLATDLVIKYERQLWKKQVDIMPVKENPQFRIPIRVIDRTTRVWIEADQIFIKFPYNIATIDQLREQSKVSCGCIHWDNTKKYWIADLTEYNLNWVCAFSRQQNYQIDRSVQELMHKILAEEQQPYAIELQAANTLIITNTTTALTDYVMDNLGGFDLDNLLTLVDHAPILGYTVNNNIKQAIIDTYGTRFWSLCTNKELRVDLDSPVQDQIAEIVKYATENNRFPIYIYEPDLSDRLYLAFEQYFPTQMVRLGGGTIDSSVKVVHTSKIPRVYVERIPLLVSSAGMLFGGDRQIWIQTAEKIVYFTKDVYNKVKRGRDICKLN
jgi:hypothetical protein